jgi:glyoxylate carboligase
VLWSMLASAGVKRCYGIVGDALNPVIDALRRNGGVEFIQVRNRGGGGFRGGRRGIAERESGGGVWHRRRRSGPR